VQNHIFKLIEQEKQRQEGTINLIASENYTSTDVLRATGSVLTNKYAEGYPGQRYYGGCGVIDEVELYAIAQGKKLFRAEHLNVQPHSGASANFAVYLALLNPGDTVLGMNLSAGGHLTHGHKINFSGKIYNFISYGVDQTTELIDYVAIETLAQQHKPKMIVAGTSAYSRLIDYERIARVAQDVGAFFFYDMAHIAGLVAAEVIPSPLPWADVVSSTTHKTLRGPRGGIICSKAAFGARIDKAVMPGSQGGPLMHVIAAKGVSFDEALQPSFTTYARQILANAAVMAKTFKDLGYRLISGGTDTHLFLLDLRSAKHLGNIVGKEAEEALGKCNIIVNRNAIPFDTLPPTVTSGIRIGTPAITTRGCTEKDATQIAAWIDEALRNRTDEKFLKNIAREVETMCARLPVYGNVSTQTVATSTVPLVSSSCSF
jgi:glycine hydroxymethyltransferase